MNTPPPQEEPRAHEPAVSIEDVEAIVLAEFNYWKYTSDDCMLAIAAVGAAANIFAAIKGARAPWHPKPPAA